MANSAKAGQAAAPPTRGEELTRYALRAGKPALLWRRRIADTETPVSAALKLIEPNRGDFLLESVEGGNVRGRHSLIGIDPDLIIRARGRSAEINRHWQQDRSDFAALDGDPLAELRALVAECAMVVPEELPRALSCLVGYFGYETVGLVEKLPRPPENPLDLPDLLFVRPSLIAIFDRLSDEMFLIAPVWPQADGDVDALIERAITALDEAERKLSAPLSRAAFRYGAIPVPAFAPQLAPGRLWRDGGRGKGLYRSR